MRPINHAHLRRLDLNLLLALDALLTEGNVTRAAQKLGLGQPAVSHALGRLRELLDDPILIREGTSMVLSARATALVHPLRETLAQLQGILTASQPFDPATSEATFRLAVSPHVEAVLFPQLIAATCDAAPGVRFIASQPPRVHTLELLDDGALHLALGVYETDKSWHRSEALFNEGFCVVFDSKFGNAALREDFLNRPHALVSTHADLTGRLDAILAPEGLSRKVSYSTPNFLTLAQVLPGTPMITCVPESLGCRIAGENLTVAKPPVNVGRFTLSMIWHARDDADPSHSWLREEIRSASAERAVAGWSSGGRLCSSPELDAVVR
jgi:DNA-binding transcriptional LysR family regulator